MTRDAEHTPTGYEDAASVVVNQAPAPSSLAGGEREAVGDVISHAHDWRTALTVMLEKEIAEGPQTDGHGNVTECAGTHYWQHQLNVLDRILAALSPEAPARDGGVALDALADWLVMRERQSTDGAQQHIEKAPAKHFCAGKASAFREVASVLWNSPEWFAALTPRHEAPAPEGDA